MYNHIFNLPFLLITPSNDGDTTASVTTIDSTSVSSAASSGATATASICRAITGSSPGICSSATAATSTRSCFSCGTIVAIRRIVINVSAATTTGI